MQAFSLSALFARESAMLKLPEDRRKGSGEGGGGPSPLSFFRPRTDRKGYSFYSPQSSTVIKSEMVASTILRTRTRFRPPKIRLHCRLDLDKAAHGGLTRALKYCLYAIMQAEVSLVRLACLRQCTELRTLARTF